MKNTSVIKFTSSFKRSISFVAIVLSSYQLQAQVIPKFEFGIKGGANLSKLTEKDSFSSTNRAGSLFGIWARASGMGVHLQPELYYTVKAVEVENASGQAHKVDFTSIDLPVLLGAKIGAAGSGARINTGPVISFIIDKEQSVDEALSNVENFRYKNQAVAWQVGIGVDVRKISVDLRYEHGLSKIKSAYEDTNLRLFNFSVGYRLY